MDTYNANMGNLMNNITIEWINDYLEDRFADITTFINVYHKFTLSPIELQISYNSNGLINTSLDIKPLIMYKLLQVLPSIKCRWSWYKEKDQESKTIILKKIQVLLQNIKNDTLSSKYKIDDIHAFAGYLTGQGYVVAPIV
jgi:hypothetical protein